MQQPSPNDRTDDRYRDPEAALGGADATPKTTYVTGAGTSPEARRKGAAATVPTGGLPRGITLTIMALVVLAGIVLVLGLGS